MTTVVWWCWCGCDAATAVGEWNRNLENPAGRSGGQKQDGGVLIIIMGRERERPRPAPPQFFVEMEMQMADGDVDVGADGRRQQAAGSRGHGASHGMAEM